MSGIPRQHPATTQENNDPFRMIVIEQLVGTGPLHQRQELVTCGLALATPACGARTTSRDAPLYRWSLASVDTPGMAASSRKSSSHLG